MARVSVSQSVHRTIHVLEIFGTERRPLTRAEIGEHLEAPRSSVAALLRAMTELGVLRLDRHTWTYFPTARIGRITRWIDGVYTIDRVVRELAKRLQANTCETITLTTPMHDVMEVIHVEHGLYPVSYVAEVGQVIPLWTSAVGKAYLSSLPDTAVGDLFRESRRNRKRATARLTVGEIRTRVQRVRRKGYAMVTGSIASDAAAIAVPVRQANELKPLVLAVCGPKSRLVMNRQQIVRILASELADIERQVTESGPDRTFRRAGT